MRRELLSGGATHSIVMCGHPSSSSDVLQTEGREFNAATEYLDELAVKAWQSFPGNGFRVHIHFGDAPECRLGTDRSERRTWDGT